MQICIVNEQTFYNIMLSNLKKNPSFQNKNILHSLVNIFGINKFSSEKVCRYFGINPKMKIENLDNRKITKLENYLKTNFKTGQNLKNQTISIKKNLLELKSYRGLRNWYGLPVRGQRTSTNGKTKKKTRNKITL